MHTKIKIFGIRTSGMTIFGLVFLSLFFVNDVLALSTLDKVKKRGYLLCGVSQGLPGFSNPDRNGNWRGIDVDFCRAMASAIFSNSQRVKFVPLSSKERFTALQSGEIDVLSRNTTWTMRRDTALGFEFIGINYYDGQGFIVRKNLNVKSALELDGASVCVNAGTTTELNIADFFRANNMKYEIVTFEKTDEVVAAYDNNRCDVYSTDQSSLYANRLKLRDEKEHVILKDVISKEPLGPLVRQSDSRWADIARWSLFAMVNGEYLGLTSKNINRKRASKNPEIRRFVGTEGKFGKVIGLGDDWAYQIIRQVGNYGESFDRNLGRSSALKIQRGYNRLWTNGGLIYAPPIR